MKIQLLAAATVLAILTTTTASAGKLNIDIMNDSENAVAVGNAIGIAAAGGSGGFAGTLGAAFGGRAEAGSVLVNAVGRKCNCKIDVYIDNYSKNAVSLGNGSAGSTVVRL